LLQQFEGPNGGQQSYVFNLNTISINTAGAGMKFK